MDSALLRDHEELRTILYPLIKGNLNDIDWRCENNRLFFSNKYFETVCPTAASRQILVEAKRREAAEELLLADHAELQRIIFPRIADIFDEDSFIRNECHDFRLFCSPKFFAELCRSPEHRRDYLDSKRQELAVKDAAKETRHAAVKRFLRRSQSDRESERPVKENDSPGDGRINRQDRPSAFDREQ